jgi:hypothetical protein
VTADAENEYLPDADPENLCPIGLVPRRLADGRVTLVDVLYRVADSHDVARVALRYSQQEEYQQAVVGLHGNCANVYGLVTFSAEAEAQQFLDERMRLMPEPTGEEADVCFWHDMGRDYAPDAKRRKVIPASGHKVKRAVVSGECAEALVKNVLAAHGLTQRALIRGVPPCEHARYRQSGFANDVSLYRR